MHALSTHALVILLRSVSLPVQQFGGGSEEQTDPFPLVCGPLALLGAGSGPVLPLFSSPGMLAQACALPGGRVPRSATMVQRLLYHNAYQTVRNQFVNQLGGIQVEMQWTNLDEDLVLERCHQHDAQHP